MKIDAVNYFFANSAQNHKKIEKKGVKCEKNSNELEISAYKNKAAVSFGALANPAKMVEKLEKRLQKEGSNSEIIKSLSKNLAYCIDSITLGELNFRQIVQKYEKYGITKENYLKCIKKQPRLMHVSLSGLDKHFEAIMEKYAPYGATLEDYIKSCLRFPQLFETQPLLMRQDKTFFATAQQSEKTVIAKVESELDIKAKKISDRYFEDGHIAAKKFKECARRQDTLETLHAEIILNRIARNSTLLKKNGLSKKDFMVCATKQPSLMYTKPETLSAKLEDVVKTFEKFNLTKEEYVKMAKKAPSLLYQSPETLLKNVLGVADIFKNYGLSEEKYFNCIKKQPTLFGLSPKTVEKNIIEAVETFKNEGLTTEQYLKIAQAQPALFYYSAKSIEAKVDKIVQAFEKEGLTRTDVIKAAKTNTAILTLAPETIINRIKIRDFVTKDRLYGQGQNTCDLQNIKNALSNILTYSDKKNYLQFLKVKILKATGKNSALKGNVDIEAKMAEYLKNYEGDLIKFDVINHKKAQEFIEFASEFSKSACGKDLFSITVKG